MKIGRKRSRTGILYVDTVRSNPVEGKCFKESRDEAHECLGDQGLGGGVLLEIQADPGDVGQQGMGGQPLAWWRGWVLSCVPKMGHQRAHGWAISEPGRDFCEVSSFFVKALCALKTFKAWVQIFLLSWLHILSSPWIESSKPVT